MDVLPFFWKWDAELPSHVLAAVDAEMNATPMESGRIFAAPEYTVRESEVALRPGWHWLAGVLGNYAVWANEQARWGFTLGKPDAVQFTRYSAGHHYDWHTDTLLMSAAPVTRKISVICLLSGPEEYDGGDLELEGVSPAMRLARGSVIAFPSAVRHRVTPVTRGVRRTLVSWVLGPNLK